MPRAVACVIGTRIGAIKMAPVVAALRVAGCARCVVVAIGQHRDLLDQMLERLAVSVDHDLNLMTDGVNSFWLTAPSMCSLVRIPAAQAYWPDGLGSSQPRSRISAISFGTASDCGRSSKALLRSAARSSV